MKRSFGEASTPEVGEVARAMSKLLHNLGVRHAIVGGLAVGVHGWPRMTMDVDFLLAPGTNIGELLKGRHKALRAPGYAALTTTARGVKIDFLTPDEDGPVGHLAAAVDAAEDVQGVPILGLAPLVAMKLYAGRARDQADVVEMLKALESDAAAEAIRRYLREHAPDLQDDFESLVVQAEVEWNQENT